MRYSACSVGGNKYFTIYLILTFGSQLKNSIVITVLIHYAIRNKGKPKSITLFIDENQSEFYFIDSVCTAHQKNSVSAININQLELIRAKNRYLFRDLKESQNLYFLNLNLVLKVATCAHY